MKNCKSCSDKANRLNAPSYGFGSYANNDSSLTTFDTEFPHNPKNKNRSYGFGSYTNNDSSLTTFDTEFPHNPKNGASYDFSI